MISAYHLISNPTAGKNKKSKTLALIKKMFAERGLVTHTHFTQSSGDATRIVKELTEAGEKEIIAIGGDGTLHEVLNGLHDPTACRLGIIPAGTGNDFAEHLGLPLQLQDAVKVILDGKTRETDYLEVGGTRCMNVAGIGMDVDVLERCLKGKSRGKLKYLKSLLQSVFAFKGYDVELKNGDELIEKKVLLTATCNGSQFGGGIRICPVANSEDGKMDVVVVDSVVGKFKLVRALLMLLKGKILDFAKTTHFLCEEFTVRSKTPCPVQLDGELYYDLDFSVKLCRGLNVYRP
ncbi:MAG: diacylglycerol kinase family lipid kinase [Clostridia bacterium]|nr:diacylglycerol kinase family lipid kinase [Clostridia bacterium]